MKSADEIAIDGNMEKLVESVNTNPCVATVAFPPPGTPAPGKPVVLEARITLTNGVRVEVSAHPDGLRVWGVSFPAEQRSRSPHGVALLVDFLSSITGEMLGG